MWPFKGGDDKPVEGDPKLFERFSINFQKKYGEGGYGATYEATAKETGERVAVKIIDTRRMKLEAIQKESQILETLTHPNVIHVQGHGLGVGKYRQLYFIFMELASGGELFDQVINNGAMNEATAKAFFCQLLDGVAYCHLAGVAHRDLKLENVLVAGGATMQLKLIDFGLSHVYPRNADKTVDASRPLMDVCGSKSYAAPEVLGAQGYNGFAADMWSLGVCLFAMLAGFFPLDEASHNDWRYPKLRGVQERKGNSTKEIFRWYKRSAAHLSPEVVDLLNRLLTIEPTGRLTMEQARAHPWVQGTKLAQMGFVGSAEQGALSMGAVGFAGEVGDEMPAYRGALPSNADEATYPMDMDDDDEPVYRSIGDLADMEASAAAPAMLLRQRAFSNLNSAPKGGLGALDALIAGGADPLAGVLEEE